MERTLCRNHRHRPSAAHTSWGGEAADWDLEPAASDSEDEADEAEASVLPPHGQGSGGPEFAVQNVLAAALLGVFVLSFGGVVVKLVAVGVALASAAFRYTAVGLLLFLLLAFFA